MTRPLKVITAIIETLLGVPILSGIALILTMWTPLLIALVLHIIVIVYSCKENKKIRGNVIGLIGSVLGILPVVGFVLHIISAVILWKEVYKDE